MSRRVKGVLTQFSPEIENYSIDESFLSPSVFKNVDLTDYGRRIRETVLRWTGIPTCVGIGTTKTLANIGNKLAKKKNVSGGS